MFKVDFGASIRPKGCFDVLTKNKFESDGFLQSGKKNSKLKKQLDKITPTFEFLNSDAKKSKSLPEHMFTNFLTDLTPGTIKTSIFDIFDNPSIVDTPNAGVVRLTKPKIEACLNLYLDPLPENAYIVKSNLIDALGQPKHIRVFTIMEFVTEPDLKAIYKIILIDPFHLVIPSKHGEKSKEEMEHDTYNHNRDNVLCMNDYYRQAIGF
ncbi:hypothetical protein HW560_11780 [Paenibacillus sp. E222]|uniref:hypothetical protein n=1 Tax=Paenibacillus sp. E222 TaxID=2748863 RepID=UPI0015C58CFF|nr:hypothetical protein [Paenibacillus sp. E222]QLG38719.1 hypothetical protein HW560_11780 [Paenibacillus sp. E222]